MSEILAKDIHLFSLKITLPLAEKVVWKSNAFEQTHFVLRILICKKIMNSMQKASFDCSQLRDPSKPQMSKPSRF